MAAASSEPKEAVSNNPGLHSTPDDATKGYIMQQTMFRLKDPKVSLDFYSRVLGMSGVTHQDLTNVKSTNVKSTKKRKLRINLKGYALLSTSPGDVNGAKQVIKQNISREAKVDQVPDMKMLTTLAKYLWSKDNLEFRLRVIVGQFKEAQEVFSQCNNP